MTNISFIKSFPKYLESISGKFFIDKDGIAKSFEPSKGNEFIIENTELKDNYIHSTSKSIRTFIVPEGVKGFVSDFMRHTKVIERFELPDGLLSIGNNSSDIEEGMHRVFANCILPSVIIPDSVKELGVFAFGNSHIETLQVPPSLRSPYGRQFKDSYIENLVLPSNWKDIISVDSYNHLKAKLDYNDFGYLIWPSTLVGKLEFY